MGVCKHGMERRGIGTKGGGGGGRYIGIMFG